MVISSNNMGDAHIIIIYNYGKHVSGSLITSHYHQIIKLFVRNANFALNQIITADQRIRFFTLLSVFIMAGLGLSPVLGAWLEQAGQGIAMAFWINGGLCFLSAALFAVLHRPFCAQIDAHAANPAASAGATSTGDTPAGATSAGDTSIGDQLSIATIRQVFQSRAALPIIMVGLGASVFAAMTNFQVVYAAENGFDYADYFLAYTAAVIICRVLFAEFVGGRNPYGTIALLLAVMAASVALFILLGNSRSGYIMGAALFGIGYGVAYPIVKAMAANDADAAVMPQTMQLFGLSYFIGVFGFPFIAGWLIVTLGLGTLLVTALALAIIETALASWRYFASR